MALTTRDRWGINRTFRPYIIERRGERNVPQIYLGAARWRTIRGDTGYYVNIPTRPSQWYPVEFNFENLCWVEIAWNAPQNYWDVLRPAGLEYCCDIPECDVQTRGNWGPIDGQDETNASGSSRTPAPSEASEETAEDDESESEQHEQEAAIEEITELAEQIAIRDAAAAPIEHIIPAPLAEYPILS